MNLESRWSLARLAAAVLLLAGFGLFMLVVTRASWLCDDAYISFRTVDNFVSGHGLRWNVLERVQSYTHPLWLFVVAAVYSFTHEIYASVQVLSLIVTALAVGGAIFFLLDSTASAVVALAALTFSKAFVEYSTSGLENPLLHLMVVLFFAVNFSAMREVRKSFLLVWLAACAALTRPDSLLLFLPPILLHLIVVHRLRACIAACFGFLPLILWMAFSLFYYGALVPNTFYAKLDAGIAQVDLVRQGMAYFVSHAEMDPLTLALLLSGLALPFLLAQWRAAGMALGALLYLAYVVCIGGDFMVGRFLSAPLLIAVILLTGTPMRARHAVMALPAIVLLGFMAPYPIVLTDAAYGSDRVDVPENAFRDERGVSDQRGFYYQATGLLRGPTNGWQVNHEWARRGARLREDAVSVTVQGAVGFKGFHAGPEVHIVDVHALCDPLLARLPAASATRWQIGHFVRALPAGYVASLSAPAKAIEDEDLRAYYEKLRLVTRGPLFDSDRLRAVLALQRGEFQHWLVAFTARIPKTDARKANVRGTPSSAAPPPGPASRPDWSGADLE